MDHGNGRRPPGHGSNGRRPDDRAMVPLPVAFPMVVLAHVYGDSADDDSTDDAIRTRLSSLDDDDDMEGEDHDDDALAEAEVKKRALEAGILDHGLNRRDREC